MADEKISQLPDGGAPQAADQLPIARSGSTLSMLWSSILSALNLGTAATHAATDFDAAGAAATAQANAETYADGKVASVTAGDTSIVVGGTATAPTLETATLDVIATDHPPGAAWSNNSKKITSLANGSGAQDAAAFGQIPTALPPNGTAGGDLSGSYPNPSVAAIHETSGPTKLTAGTITDGQFLKRVGSTLVSAAGNAGTVTSVTATDTSIVVAGTGAAPTIATGTLDAIAAAHPPAANWSNNSHKITSVLDPTAAQDAATKNYVDTSNPGNAGGKGHITTATAVNAPADLAPGADGTVLTADSSQSTGLVYSTTPIDGWVSDSVETWTYASGSGGGTATFTVTGDVSAKYSVGTRIRLTQTTVKYFVVVADAVFGGVNTTVTISGGSDFTLANAAISANSHSYAGNPQGYPGWFNFAPATTGFGSIATSVTSFAIIARTVFIELSISGTSNATSFAITLPVQVNANGCFFVVRVTDSGTNQQGNVNVAVNTSAASFAKGTYNTTTTTFTATGTKGTICSIFYQT